MFVVCQQALASIFGADANVFKMDAMNHYQLLLLLLYKSIWHINQRNDENDPIPVCQSKKYFSNILGRTSVLVVTILRL
jgi:hypothetical protein